MGMRHVALTPPFEPTLSRIPSWIFWFNSYLMISANILSSYLANTATKTSACQTCSSLLLELVRLKLHKMCSNEGQDVTSDWHQSPPLIASHSDQFLPISLLNQWFWVWIDVYANWNKEFRLVLYHQFSFWSTEVLIPKVDRFENLWHSSNFSVMLQT